MANFLFSMVTDSLKNDAMSDLTQGLGNNTEEDLMSKFFAKPQVPVNPEITGKGASDLPQASKPKGKFGLGLNL